MGANLLGGRAWKYRFFPLTYHEIPESDLLKALNSGLIPSHYLSENPWRELESYVDDYLRQEIQIESATQNLPAFARFLDALVFSSGELINFSNVSYLSKRTHHILKGPEAGHAFEHFICMELHAYLSYAHRFEAITFWRTSSGLEVDFVIGDAKIAIEVKIQSTIDKTDLKGLTSFLEDFPLCQAYMVANIDRSRLIQISDEKSILILPWKLFLEKLFGGVRLPI